MAEHTTDYELRGLQNIVRTTRTNPENLRLAIAGALLEEDPEAALRAIARAEAAVEHPGPSPNPETDARAEHRKDQ